MEQLKSRRGCMRVYSEAGPGIKFRLYFPALMEVTTANLDAEDQRLPCGEGELVLVVDEELRLGLNGR